MPQRSRPDRAATPVVFRVHPSPKEHGSEVIAVFPCEPADMDGQTMTCYAHVGQHGACSQDWYNQTRPARPEEYADLKAELESAPYSYRLRVYDKIYWQLRDRFNEAVRKL